jgi:methyltransferase (TIGR00027 family)
MDDRLEAALNGGVKQVVIVGAGYDSRAYRLGGPEKEAVFFEIDHPGTQADKKARVSAVFADIPGHVRFIPAEFSSQALRNSLADGGYDPDRKTFFIMEGLVPYLSRQAFENILSAIGGGGDTGNEMVFDYLPPDVIDGTSTRIEAQSMYSEVKSYGECFRLGFEPGELKKVLKDNGLTILEDISAPELKPLYFRGNSVDRPVTPIFRFVHAKEAK